MKNQLFLKGKKKLLCSMAFSGCQLPFFCSTAAQCEAAAAAVVDLGALVLCKAAAPLVVETQNRCYISAKPTRQKETTAD